MGASELRKDLVSGDWTVIAAHRAKRPHGPARFSSHDPEFLKKEGCPFEEFREKRGATSLLAIDRTGKKCLKMSPHWFVHTIPNDFPAFTPGKIKKKHVGLFETMRGVGRHELVIMRDHDRHWGQYTISEASAIFLAYRERYRALLREPEVQYVAIFHNFGREAGGSLYHPHSQIMGIPVVPPDVKRSFSGSSQYFAEKNRCVHCDLLRWEKKEKKRVILENQSFTALCPFASRSAFEIRIFPKRHEPDFGEITEREVRDGGDILRKIFQTLREKLEDPPYNYFIHTATPKGRAYPHYHWHLEIIPKITVWAGFEISTGIDISTLAPETAAALLRSGRASKK